MPVISTNTAANSALNYLNKNSSSQETYLTQLSSGSRINKASDDAAGLAVAGQLEADITTLEQSSSNAEQASALLETADGALSRAADILQRMKSLATQYNSGTVDSDSRSFINAEYEELISELDLITTSTEFNGQELIDGSYSESFIVGIQSADAIDVDLSSVDTSSSGLSLSDSLSVSGSAVLTLNLSTAGGNAATETTTLADLATGITALNGTAGTIQITMDDQVNTDTLDYTMGQTNTVAELMAEINSVLDDNGEQLYTATLSNGVLTVVHNDISSLDTNDDGNVNSAVTIVVSDGGNADDGVTLDGFDATGAAISLAETANGGDDSGDLIAASTALTDISDDLEIIDAAVQSVSEFRSQVGAYMSAMEYQAENISTQIENLTAAVSTITDVDIAEAQSNFTTAQVLTEAATAALAQANNLKTSLLSLVQ